MTGEWEEYAELFPRKDVSGSFFGDSRWLLSGRGGGGGGCECDDGP
jgi:hypothetical protein